MKFKCSFMINNSQFINNSAKVKGGAIDYDTY
jgi:hypothetical protein